MAHFLVRRLLWMILVLFGVSILVFGLIHLTPGDPAQIMLGPAASMEDVRELRHQLGLDRPDVVQYARWLGRALRADVGQSIVLRRAVMGEVLARCRNTAL